MKRHFIAGLALGLLIGFSFFAWVMEPVYRSSIQQTVFSSPTPTPDHTWINVGTNVDGSYLQYNLETKEYRDNPITN